MIKRQEVADPESCLNRALAQEMLFTLLGRDESAPETIRFWARDRVLRGKNKGDDAVIMEAYKTAAHMDIERKAIRKALGKEEGR